MNISPDAKHTNPKRPVALDHLFAELSPALSTLQKLSKLR
jgi:hypothetical protein